MVFESSGGLHRAVYAEKAAIAARERSDRACEGPKGLGCVIRSREIMGDIRV